MVNDTNRLQNIDKTLAELTAILNITDLYPQNAFEEKKKFFLDKKYNPQFKYAPLSVDFAKAYRQIKKLQFKESVMDDIFKEKAKELYYTLKMFENRGKKPFSEYAIKVYGKPSKELVLESKKYYQTKPIREKESKKTISSKKAIARFEKIFKELSINWKVREEVIASNAIVVPTKRQFLIQKNRMFSEREIRRYIVHEIYTHILRAEFGLRQPYSIFSTGLGWYEATEEGLALYKEKRAGLIDKKSLLRYASRVLAVDLALHGSFRDTFTYLSKMLGEEKAWVTTLRVKRGMADTSQKGAFTKDYIYFKGYREVSDFVKNQSCLHLLHYGKIGIDHALLIPRIEGLKNPFLLLKNHFNQNIHDLSILY